MLHEGFGRSRPLISPESQNWKPKADRFELRSISSPGVLVENHDAILYNSIKCSVGWSADDHVRCFDRVSTCEVRTVAILHTRECLLKIVVEVRGGGPTRAVVVDSLCPPSSVFSSSRWAVSVKRGNLDNPFLVFGSESKSEMFVPVSENRDRHVQIECDVRRVSRLPDRWEAIDNDWGGLFALQLRLYRVADASPTCFPDRLLGEFTPLCSCVGTATTGLRARTSHSC
jgi:hypothetical protein